MGGRGSSSASRTGLKTHKPNFNVSSRQSLAFALSGTMSAGELTTEYEKAKQAGQEEAFFKSLNETIPTKQLPLGTKLPKTETHIKSSHSDGQAIMTHETQRGRLINSVALPSDDFDVWVGADTYLKLTSKEWKDYRHTAWK